MGVAIREVPRVLARHGAQHGMRCELAKQRGSCSPFRAGWAAMANIHCCVGKRSLTFHQRPCRNERSTGSACTGVGVSTRVMGQEAQAHTLGELEAAHRIGKAHPATRAHTS